MEDLPADDSKYRFEILDFFLGNGEIVGRENSQVSQLAWGESSLFSVFRRKPTAPHRVEFECFLAIQSVLLRIKTETPDGLAGDKPVQRKVRIVARNPGRVGSGPHRNTHLQHASDRRRTFGLLSAVAGDEIFSLAGHAVLHGDAAAERLYALNVTIRNCFPVIED